MQQMASEPNHVGSPHDKANAEFQLAKFREWGWDAAIETFSVLYPTPKEVLVELGGAHAFQGASLSEPPVEGDAATAHNKDELPPYNVYGADGDVTGELVYVNHGMPDDYKELERQGISVKGRIVLTRYGGGWRGLKPKLAYEHGAVGCLIYSDPRDDGYGAGDVYPKGGYRPRDAVQRGSVQDLTLYSGDPLTPGVGATAGAKRLAIKDAKTHAEDSRAADLVRRCRAAARRPRRARRAASLARRLAADLPHRSRTGAGAHEGASRTGPRRPIYDVIAKIRGSEEPDRWVIRGNHHDGWVFGAADPLVRADRADGGGQGRSASWSRKAGGRGAPWCTPAGTAKSRDCWARPNGRKRMPRNSSAKAVLYVNSDVNDRGFLHAEGSSRPAALRQRGGPRRQGSRDRRQRAGTRAVAAQRVAAFEAPRSRPRAAAPAI